MNAWLDHNIYTLWKGFVSQFRILSSSVFLPLEGFSTKNANTDLDQKWSLRCVSRLSALTDSGLKSKLHPFCTISNKCCLTLEDARWVYSRRIGVWSHRIWEAKNSSFSTQTSSFLGPTHALSLSGMVGNIKPRPNNIQLHTYNHKLIQKPGTMKTWILGKPNLSP